MPQSILFVTYDFPPDSGGIQRATQRLAAAAAEAGHRVEVLAPAAPGAAGYDRTQPFRVTRFARRKGVLKYFEIAARTLAVQKRFHPDRLIAMTWNAPALALAPLRLLGLRIPLTVVAHGSEIATQNSLPRRLLLRFALRGADIAANSSYTAGLVRERGIERVRMSNPGADSVIRAAAPRFEQPTILCAGRLVPRKGYDRVITALPSLLARFPDIRLVVVGDGPDRGRLEDLVRSLGVAGSVTFLGRVDDDELARQYAGAWCFAMPNRREGNDVEGFGIVFLEAALHGLASVGGRGSGAEDAIVQGQTGYLVDGESAEQVSHALLLLLADRATAEAMGEAARRRTLEHFTWRRYADELLQEPARNGQTTGKSS